MRIAVTADNHVSQMEQEAKMNFDAMMQNVMSDNISVFCIAGDLGEGLLIPGCSAAYERILNTHPVTLFVMGNHDLWRPRKRILPPDQAMAENLKQLCWGNPLEKSWDDTSTVFTMDDCSFVGTVGFPDFNHPLLAPRKTYEVKENIATVDTDYISLKRWCDYTDSLNRAFMVRLNKAAAVGSKHVIIISHYPCFPSHSKVNPRDRIWPYFYNYQLGRWILDVADSHKEKTFWCIAGHSHEYCLGLWSMELENIYTMGIRTTYSMNTCVTFDTNEDPIKNRSATA